LRLFKRSYLFKKGACKLLFHVWHTLEHRSETNKVKEDLVKRLCQVLLIRSIQNVPILPENFAENFFRNIFVLYIVFRVYSYYFRERFHEVLKIGLLSHILDILGMEGLQSCQDSLSILRLSKSLLTFQFNQRV